MPIKDLLREVCLQDIARVPQAVALGGGRIELCDHLDLGGTTPTPGLVERTLALVQGLPVMAMLRPRGGNFHYSEEELAIMQGDLTWLLETSVAGIVLGILTSDGQWIDEAALEPLVEEIQAVDKAVTFHMAFDHLPRDRQKEAIDYLASLGVERILTHGSPQADAIEPHLDYLQDLVAYAGDRILLLPGGGVTTENAQEVARTLGVHEVHGTRVV